MLALTSIETSLEPVPAAVQSKDNLVKMKKEQPWGAERKHIPTFSAILTVRAQLILK